MAPHKKSITELEAKNLVLRGENAELRAAIASHKRNVWGDGPVGHDEDVALYGAMRGTDDGAGTPPNSGA